MNYINDNAKEDTAEKAESQEFSKRLESLTVLFVDDEANVLRSIGRVLRHEPYRILTASSAAEALEILNSQEIQMIVSDQRMPKATGIELLETARELYPDTIRLMLTGYSDLKTAEEAINKVEIYRFLSKPWNDEDLKATIRQGLMKWQLKKDNERMMRIIEAQNTELRDLNQNLEKKVEDRTRELKEAEARLIQSEKMASVGLLAGGIAHEINNPLAGILAFTQLLLMELADNEEAVDDLKTIEKAVLQCKEIVQNLLNFSRQGESKTREPVDVPLIFKRALNLIGYIFRNSQIQIVEEYEPDLPQLRGNPNQFQQVIINLLTNAQQAMKNGGTINIRGKKDENGGLIVEVEDQGEGIPESIRARIFDPFFTTKPEGKGTGLGLSVSYGIVRDHGGRIEVISECGKGTCMRLVFDAAEDYF
jgi:signal transduction histidine kinase